MLPSPRRRSNRPTWGRAAEAAPTPSASPSPPCIRPRSPRPCPSAGRSAGAAVAPGVVASGQEDLVAGEYRKQTPRSSSRREIIRTTGSVTPGRRSMRAGCGIPLFCGCRPLKEPAPAVGHGGHLQLKLSTRHRRGEDLPSRSGPKCDLCRCRRRDRCASPLGDRLARRLLGLP